MAKTLVDPNQIEISISLLNLINRSVRINKNTCITDLDPVESVHHIAPQSPPICKRSEFPDHLSAVFDKISDEASGTEKDQIKNL